MSNDKPCVLLGVTGCIAAYKSCEILRGLQKRGARVKVVMTEHATHFVDPTTFRALTHEPVAVGLFDEPGDPIHHISLAEECDLFLIAPCTANVAAKIAIGIADDLLTTTALATTAPLMIAPAMNVHMYEAEATQENFATLRARGVRIVDADEGYLACGDVGRGRLADVDAIVAAALDALDGRPQRVAGDMEGVRVLVTAGPTVEPIDAVRFISNRSSGKMGYAIVRAAQRRGAVVELVSGPVALEAPAGVNCMPVETAASMHEAAAAVFPQADIAIFAAAVADVRPAQSFERKLKKGLDDTELSTIELVENVDILKTLAATKRADQCVVGFAAETDDLLAHAQAKLFSKHADLIVANEVAGGKVFGADVNEAYLVDECGARQLPLMTKDELADAILDAALAVRRGEGRRRG